MVRAILEGRKTQTRRIVKPQPDPIPDDVWKDPRVPSDKQFWWPSRKAQSMVEIRDMGSLGPYGARGDRLWVKERFGYTTDRRGTVVLVYSDDADARFVLAEDNGEGDFCGLGGRADRSVCNPVDRWRPSIHMPRWACRLVLEITGVRVERLQDGGDREFWGEKVWTANPWVWAISFKRVGGAA